jgi:hypothetical protein
MIAYTTKIAKPSVTKIGTTLYAPLALTSSSILHRDGHASGALAKASRLGKSRFPSTHSFSTSKVFFL